MAQHDYVIANGTGAAVRSDLNNALAAIVSNNSGATEPATTYAYQFWADTTTGTLKLRNSANSAFIELMQLDGTLTMEDGTEALPGLSFRNDLDTGLWRPGTNQLAISTNAVERVEFGASEVVFNDGGANYDFRVEGDTNANLLFVDASADAVGIGSSSPQWNLTIQGASTSYTQFVTSTTGTASTDGSLVGLDSNNSLVLRNRENTEVLFYTNDQQRAVIDNQGRLGIGTTSVTGKLSIDGSALNPISSLNTASNYAIALYGGSATGAGNGIAFCNDNGTSVGGAIVHIDQGSNNLGDLAFYTAATANSPSEKARLTASGQWLVGTSSARNILGNNQFLQVEGTGSNNAWLSSFVYNAASSFGPAVILGKTRSGSAGGVTSVSSGDVLGKIAFHGADGTDLDTPGAEITCEVDGTPGANDMPGRLTFSTTADGASSPTERCRISNLGKFYARAASTDVAFFSTGSGAAAGDSFISCRHSSTTVTDGTEVFRVRTTGDVQNTNNSYGAISDIKLKENIVDATPQWSDIKALQVRKYNFKEETGHQTHTQIGLIAQEVELVSPGLVSESPDRDEDGNDLGTVTKSVNYSVLYMKAVKALQEAMERIEQLEQRLTDAGIA